VHTPQSTFLCDLPFWLSCTVYRPLKLPFCCYKALKLPTYFRNLMTLRTRLTDGFHHLVPKDNFHYQTPLNNAKFDLFGSERCQLANLVVNRDWLIMCQSYRLQHAFSGSSKQLHQHDSVHLSSVYTDCSFSSLVCSQLCHYRHLICSKMQFTKRHDVR